MFNFLLSKTHENVTPRAVILALNMHWGRLQRSPDPLAEFKGPTSTGRVPDGNEREGKGGKGKEKWVKERRKGKRGEVVLPAHFRVLSPSMMQPSNSSSKHVAVAKKV